MSNNKIVKNYSSIYTIKDFAIKELAPRYLNMDKINDLNVGLLGYVTELLSNVADDTFNAITMYINEMFPNTAVLPESIYSFASLFQINDLFSTSAEMDIMLFISEKDIISNGVKKESFGEFYLDSNAIIDIEGKLFGLDYDVLITYRPYQNDYIFTASYDKNYKNSLSGVNNPYIKTKRIYYKGVKYLTLMLRVHQFTKFSKTETLISNDRLNVPSVKFEFDDQLSNFEVFYKESGKEPIQLVKRLNGSAPIKEPFCYYTFSNENQIEISFSTRDNMFKPKFNSELEIVYFTSIGNKGNFPLYKGTSISVRPKSEKYEYNNNIIVFAIPQSDSRNGRDSLTLEALKNIVIEKFSTVDSYTNENDLQLYFANFKYRTNIDVLFLKTRDDVFERLFSSFTIYKDIYKNIYHTNTLHLKLNNSNFDLEYEQSDLLILKPGHKFAYIDGSLDSVIDITEEETEKEYQFEYSNPFLMTFQKSPTIVGYYINSINKKHLLEYEYINKDSIIQFICNTLNVYRNALHSNKYTVEITLTPTSDLINDIVDKETGADLGNLIVKLFLTDGNNLDICYKDFELVEVDEGMNLYKYRCEIETDDYITINNKFRVLNFASPKDGEERQHLVPMVDSILKVVTFYNYGDTLNDVGRRVKPKVYHKYKFIKNTTEHVMTNIYSSSEDKVNFIYPLHMIKSQSKYISESGGGKNMIIMSSPLMKYSDVYDNDKLFEFLELLLLQHNYMQSELDKITNNYSVDMKFYNTYGKSKNFIVESGALLDQVNIKIHFKICPVFGAEPEELTRDLKIYIKEYIEGINEKGTNSIYISNLIQSIENDFPDVKYLKFVRINNYDSSVQVIDNVTVDLNNLTKEERKYYVPEYMTISLDDIVIDII